MDTKQHCKWIQNSSGPLLAVPTIALLDNVPCSNFCVQMCVQHMLATCVSRTCGSPPQWFAETGRLTKPGAAENCIMPNRVRRGIENDKTALCAGLLYSPGKVPMRAVDSLSKQLV